MTVNNPRAALDIDTRRENTVEKELLFLPKREKFLMLSSVFLKINQVQVDALNKGLSVDHRDQSAERSPMFDKTGTSLLD